jgi:hypothetical protein
MNGIVAVVVLLLWAVLVSILVRTQRHALPPDLREFEDRIDRTYDERDV